MPCYTDRHNHKLGTRNEEKLDAKDVVTAIHSRMYAYGELRSNPNYTSGHASRINKR
jgi:hypothetical protein